MLDPRLLRTFVAIVDAASFTVAANRLNSTQSTVSQHLGRLETVVGRSLIDRAARPIVPTLAGERLLGHARRLLVLQAEAQALIDDPAEKATIRIGLPDDIVTPTMSRRFAFFAGRHRGIRLDVTAGLSGNLTKRYRAGELDIAIVKETSASGDVRAEFPEPLAWFEAAAGDTAWTDPVPLVTFPPGGLYRDMMIQRLERERRRWYIAFTGNSLDSVLSAIEAGLGIAILPIAAVGSRAVRSTNVFGVELAMVLSIYAWESEGPIGELVEAMIDVIRRR